MALPPDDELQAGQTAYEQVRAFNRVGHRLPYLYFIGAAVGIGFFIYFWNAGPSWAFTGWSIALLLWYFGCQTHWRKLQATYLANLQLLQKQREQYGSELPWVQVEDQLIALEEIEREKAAAAKTEAAKPPA